MEVVPVVMPVTNPEELPIVAIVVVPLVQLPPGLGSVRITVPPAHNAEGPVMEPGNGFTVMMAVREQPDTV